MVIFYSYVSLPEGIPSGKLTDAENHQAVEIVEWN